MVYDRNMSIKHMSLQSSFSHTNIVHRHIQARPAWIRRSLSNLGAKTTLFQSQSECKKKLISMYDWLIQARASPGSQQPIRFLTFWSNLKRHFSRANQNSKKNWGQKRHFWQWLTCRHTQALNGPEFGTKVTLLHQAQPDTCQHYYDNKTNMIINVSFITKTQEISSFKTFC